MGTTQSTNCVLYTADTQQTMLHKLKRHFQRITQRLEGKQCRRKKVNSLPKTTTELRKKILPPMPRCSSYKSLITIDRTTEKITKKEKKSKKSTPTKDYPYAVDDVYEYGQWKIDFEAPRPQITRSERKTIMKLPEALAGQVTPNGFPAYTITARAIAATITTEEERTAAVPSQPQNFNKWRSMSMRNNQQSDDKNAADANSLSLNGTYTVRRRLSLRLPLLLNVSSNKSKYEKQEENKSMKQSQHSEKSVTQQQETQTQYQAPKFLSKMCKERANVIEKIYQEIKDLEDYYGTRLDYYHL